MRFLIIDSDDRAANELVKLLKEIAPAQQCAGQCTSVAGAVEWLQTHPMPDLIFSTVELKDGMSFNIFRQLGKRVPVIFTCRHENYAMDAFKANGIFYLIKPIKKEDLREALERFNTIYLNCYQATALQAGPHYQRRFLVSVGRQLKLIKSEDIAYFYTDNKIVYIMTFDGAKYATDYTLEGLEHILDPVLFFRINRQFIINISAIVKMIHASKSRLQVFLRPQTDYSTITSFGRTESFCKWMLGELPALNSAVDHP